MVSVNLCNIFILYAAWHFSSDFTSGDFNDIETNMGIIDLL